MPRYYIFASDPHGTGQPWIDLVKQAQKDYPDSQTIFGGDYIDGNKHSKETVDFVMDQVQNHHAQALKGNHEQLMEDFVDHNDDLWYYNGAKTTIKSFFDRGFSKHTARYELRMDDRYTFLINLPKIIETNHFIFVHAGIACWTKNYRDHETYKNRAPLFSMMDGQDYFYLWSRENYWYGDGEYYVFAHNITGKTIVTGHTPTTYIEGIYDNDQDGIEPTFDYEQGPDNDPKIVHRACPVRKVQYEGEAPRYFTDGGCHGNNNHHGNICVFDNKTGLLVKTYNSDTGDIKFVPHDDF